MLVAFWGPTPGQTCTTSSMLAVAAMLALDYPLKIAITHPVPRETLIERSMGQLRSQRGISSSGDSGGMDAILRLAECEMLTPTTLRDHTESVLKGRLDVLRGPTMNADDRLLMALPQLKSSASRYYDLFFIDVAAGTENLVTKQVLAQADLIVVTLNQNVEWLERYFADVDKAQFPNSKKEEVLCERLRAKLQAFYGSYKKQYKLHSSDLLGVVPHNVRLMDALNDGNLLDLLLRSMAVKKQMFVHDENLAFISSIRDIGKLLLRSLDLAPLEEVSLD